MIRCCVCISGRVDSLLVFFLYDSLYKAFGKEINNTCKRYLKDLVVRFTNLPLVNTFQHVFFHHHFHIASIWKKRNPSLEYIYILWKIVEWVRVLVFNATFNNISVISSVLLVEETGVPEENHKHGASNWSTLSQKFCIECTSPWVGFELTTLVMIGTDYICSCKINYHTITTAQILMWCQE